MESSCIYSFRGNWLTGDSAAKALDSGDSVAVKKVRALSGKTDF
jgi:hypothetical protein